MTLVCDAPPYCQVILKRETDLLAMAPTGSGKTAVALLAILQAFTRGQRAIYTSPIKALSNQKFAEFKEWFRKKGGSTCQGFRV